MIYRTVRISKASVDKDGNSINEDNLPSRQWEDLVTKVAFRLETVMTWEEYLGDGGNEVNYFQIDNEDLCCVETEGGAKIVIMEKFEDFNKVMEDFEANILKNQLYLNNEINKSLNRIADAIYIASGNG